MSVAYQGPHFTLLAFGPEATEALPELPWPAEGAELRRYAVRTGHRIDDEGTLADSTGRLTSIYGITGDTLILIRPDGYVASIITSDWTTAFTAASKAFVPRPPSEACPAPQSAPG
ncbi:hypothetical protein [Streptomyces lateritius]|uniref:hypothetical protein n=1 Tax=Streptomyces lateritius TaxID=67313 RepID=UPI00167B7B54|nr:hypothetical protein [Streptomyces lateritius]GGT93102.1 hypothetical protein GCM10010272_42440 [Streptomyces lateritius]